MKLDGDLRIASGIAQAAHVRSTGELQIVQCHRSRTWQCCENETTASLMTAEELEGTNAQAEDLWKFTASLMTSSLQLPIAPPESGHKALHPTSGI